MRKRYAVYASNSGAIYEGSLTACLRFIARCMGGYTELHVRERA